MIRRGGTDNAMRLLVTGGAGYIGSVTAAELVRRGHDVVIVDDLRSGHRDLVPYGADLIEADVGEPMQYEHVMGQIDACLHFAASAEAGISMQRPEAFFHNNTAATLRLLASLIDHGVGRFVLSSTCAVYGDPPAVPITEDAPTRPTNVYGHSKLLIEQALTWLHELRGLRYSSLRYFNAAGATSDRGEDHPVETHLIPRVLETAAGRRDAVEIFGTDYPTPDGTCVRDYIHVADLADAHVVALERLDDRSRIVCNLGTGSGFSVREIVEAAERVTGAPIPTKVSGRRAGDPPNLVAAADHAQHILGWRPRRTQLDEIVESAWRWHQRRWAPRT